MIAAGVCVLIASILQFDDESIPRANFLLLLAITNILIVML
jgi:hypothetical protein